MQNIYGRTAISATKYCREEALHPGEAWKKAVSEFTKNESSQKKGCPRCAFLGLCEDGAVSGIPAAHYCNSEKNKKYALNALSLLKQNPSLSDDKKTLWQAVMKAVGESEGKAENGQLDVVLSLWRENLIGTK